MSSEAVRAWPACYDWSEQSDYNSESNFVDRLAAPPRKKVLTKKAHVERRKKFGAVDADYIDYIIRGAKWMLEKMLAKGVKKVCIGGHRFAEELCRRYTARSPHTIRKILFKNRSALKNELDRFHS